MHAVSKRIDDPASQSRGTFGVSLAIRLVVCVSLMLVGVAISAWAYRFGQPDGPLFYWGILPGAPLVLIAIAGMFPLAAMRVVLGAAAGCLLGVGLPYGLLLYASTHYSGGGANIGLGLLLLATPLYVPVAILIGGAAGYRLFRTANL